MPDPALLLVISAAVALEAASATEDAGENQKDNDYDYYDPDPLISEPEKSSVIFIFSHVMHSFHSFPFSQLYPFLFLLRVLFPKTIEGKE